jgi:hypothetical protein
MARAKDMTSRPQPFASVTGFTNKPNPERKPKDSSNSMQALSIKNLLEADHSNVFSFFIL